MGSHNSPRRTRATAAVARRIDAVGDEGTHHREFVEAESGGKERDDAEQRRDAERGQGDRKRHV